MRSTPFDRRGIRPVLGSPTETDENNRDEFHDQVNVYDQEPNNEAPTLRRAQSTIILLPTLAFHEKWSAAEIVILMVGLTEGLTHLANLAICYLFKDDLGLSPSQVSLLFVAPSFPWFLKPLFAFYSDSYPLFGKRRQPYLFLSSALQSLGYYTLAFVGKDLLGAVLALFLIAFSSAFCSAIAEALLVECSEANKYRLPSETVSNFQLARAFGSLAVAYFSGSLLESISKKSVFLVTAVFPLIITISSLFIEDQSASPNLTVAAQVSDLFTFLKMRVIWGPALFILAFMIGPDYDDALFFYYTNVLGLGPAFMGSLKLTYGIATIAGTLLYQAFLQKTSYRRLLASSILLSLPIYLSFPHCLHCVILLNQISTDQVDILQKHSPISPIFAAPLILISGLNLRLGISDKLFVLSGGFLNEAVAEIQLIPLLVLVATMCPPGLEGSAYSTLFAVRYLGSALSKANSAVFMNVLDISASRFTTLSLYVWICGAFNLFPFLFLHLIPSEDEILQAREKMRRAYDDRKNINRGDLPSSRDALLETRKILSLSSLQPT